ncbi:MAG: glycosyltransferase family 39 protein [Pseudomonadales bacterium]|nr:glycosyltransferase family 39 protein [Pseudomonadales bacterium]
MKKLWKIFALLYIISFLTRIFYFINHVPFAQDQIRDVLFIREIISNGKYFIPFGPSTSVGNFFLPPLYYYFQLLSHIIFFNKFYAMDLFVILIESLTPLMIFFVTHKLTKKIIPSIFSGLIYIFSPMVLIASYAWNPNLIPFFSTLFLVSVLVYFIDKKKHYLGSALISFVVLINLHFQWFVLLPLLLILLFHSLKNLKITWKILVFSSIFCIMLMSPYLFVEFQSKFGNSTTAMEFLNNKELVFERVRIPAYISVFFPNFFHRFLFNNLFINNWEFQYENFGGTLIINSILFWLIILIYFKYALKDLKKKNSLYPAIYITIFTFMSLFLRLYKGDKPDYYLYVFMQFMPILLVYSISNIVRKHIVRNSIFIFIISLEIISFLKIPSYNAYNLFKDIADEVKQLDSKVYIETTNQELDLSLKYFLLDDLTSSSDINTADYYVLVCYTNENCSTKSGKNDEMSNKVVSNKLYSAVFIPINK